MQLYDCNGYFTMEDIRKSAFPFIIVCGGRGTGKTFGTLYDILKHNEKFIYLRRQQNQIDLVGLEQLNPFKPINELKGEHITASPMGRYVKGFFRYQEKEDGTKDLDNEPVGVGMALSTFQNMRGFDASDYDWIVWDEFIPQANEPELKEEFTAFANAYETCARNREIQGKPPLRAILLSNSNSVNNSTFRTLRIIGTVQKMIDTRQEIRQIKKNGVDTLLLIMLYSSPISDKKRDTALYRLTEGTSYADMALNNNFVSDDMSLIKSLSLKNFRPLVSIGEITIYASKAEEHALYVTSHASGTVKTYGTTDRELKAFRRRFGILEYMYTEGMVTFETYEVKIAFLSYLNLL